MNQYAWFCIQQTLKWDPLEKARPLNITTHGRKMGWRIWINSTWRLQGQSRRGSRSHWFESFWASQQVKLCREPLEPVSARSLQSAWSSYSHSHLLPHIPTLLESLQLHTLSLPCPPSSSSLFLCLTVRRDCVHFCSY